MMPLMSLLQNDEIDDVYEKIVETIRAVNQGDGDQGEKKSKYGVGSISDVKKKRKRLFVWVGKRPAGSVFPPLWGIGEPSTRPGDDCVALDSALGWKWNAVRCVVSAAVVCIGQTKCPRPTVPSMVKLRVEDKDFYELGEAAQYECRDESKVLKDEGRETIMCGQGGKWKGGGQGMTCHNTEATTITVKTTTDAATSTTTTTTTAAATAATKATATKVATTTATAAAATTSISTSTITEASTLADLADNHLSDLAKRPSTVENLTRQKSDASSSSNSSDPDGDDDDDNVLKRNLHKSEAASPKSRTMLLAQFLCLVISLLSRSQQLSVRQ